VRLSTARVKSARRRRGALVAGPPRAPRRDPARVDREEDVGVRAELLDDVTSTSIVGSPGANAASSKLSGRMPRIDALAATGAARRRRGTGRTRRVALDRRLDEVHRGEPMNAATKRFDGSA
jgi:hypothetical protein